MKIGKVGAILVILLVLINFISSAEQVVIVNNAEPEKETWFSKYVSFWLYSPVFWGAVVFALLFLLIIIGLFFLIRWIIKFIKSQNDLFFRLKKDRIKLAKIQKSYRSKHWFKVHKNTPIRLVRVINGKPKVSQPIAYHRGDYTTHEGNKIICMNLKNNKKWLFFPVTDILVIPNKETMKLKGVDERGKPTEILLTNMPRANEIVQFHDDEILLYAEGVSNSGHFYIPVLTSKDGKIIDFSLPVYQSLKEVILNDYLYSQTSDFVDVTKKAINMNANVRFETKVNDSSGSVDVPQSAK